MAHIGVSWALAQTVDGVLKVSRDAALAASGDNISPLALLACEKFGATIAISSRTQTKIEAMLRQQAKSTVQIFLLAKVGYAKGGSIDALSKNAEGIRFLSLASALVSSCNNFDAATALSTMIRDTAEDKAFTPTVYQLKDLLDVLEPSLNKSGFLDVVAGNQALMAHSQDQANQAPAVPSPAAIQTIVESFRELSRVGDADAQSLKFTIGPFAAWVSALARWSVEVPPLICDEQGQVILDQPNSQVTICISKDAKYKDQIGIETIYAYTSSQKVISAVVRDKSEPALATGMVTVETHARFLLRELEFHDGLGSRALAQALPYAVHLIKSTFARANDLGAFRIRGSEARVLAALHPLDPFPVDDVVAALVKTYLGPTHNGPLIQRLPDGLQITDLPLVRLWTEEHRTFPILKPEEEFPERLSQVVADILALSLFVAEGMIDHTKIDFLVLYIPNRRLSRQFSGRAEWASSVKDILHGRGLESRDEVLKLIQIEPVIKWAMKLVGHEASNYVDDFKWVASSFRGQVILPRILRTNEILSSGFACLSLFAGTLMLKNQKDRKFSWILSEDLYLKSAELNLHPPISAHSNAFPKDNLQWQLANRAEHLGLSMGWTHNKNTQRPLNILTALLGSAMIGSCSHLTNAELIRQEAV